MNVGTKTATLLTALAVVIITLRPGLAADRVDLEARFRQPPADAKPHVVWYITNGIMSKEGITADLEAMARVGIGGVMLGLIDGQNSNNAGRKKVLSMTPEWWDIMKHIASEAARLGIVIDMWNGPGWTGGGGSWVKRSQGMQATVIGETKAKGPGAFAGVLPQPTLFLPDISGGRGSKTKPNDPDYHDIAVLAYPSGDGPVARAKLIDLTDKLQADGRLTWDMPAGEWTILRIGYAPTDARGTAMPEIAGPDVDKFDRQAFEHHWQNWMVPIMEAWKAQVGTTLTRVHCDSWEVGDQNWNHSFRKEFIQRRGYDPVPYLVTGTGRTLENAELTERFQWDWRRTISDLMADNFYSAFTDKAHAHGLKSTVEAYSMANLFEGPQCGGRADIPMGEFWSDGSIGGKGDWICPMAASVARNKGQPIVGAEAFTARGFWDHSPRDLKPMGDAFYCLGINHFTLHLYGHQDVEKDRLVGTDVYWGNHLNRNNVWWDESRAWIAYLTRCQAMLQSGYSVVDICTFSGATPANDMLPGAYGAMSKFRYGYDIGGCTAETLLTRFSASDGRIIMPDGNSCRLLELPDPKVNQHHQFFPDRLMTPEVALKLRELVRAGAVVVGPKPTRSPSLQNYPECDAQVRAVADELWGAGDIGASGKRDCGKGKVYWGMTAVDVLKDLGEGPDVMIDYYQAIMTWCHRRVDDADFYYLSNRRWSNRYEPLGTNLRLAGESSRYQEAEVSFRITGRVPELWDPQTGRIETAGAWREENGRTIVPIALDPDQSVFVVFRKSSAGVPHLASAAFLTPAGKNERATALSVTAQAIDGGKVMLEAWKNGTIAVKTVEGKTMDQAVAGLPEPVTVAGPWTVGFEPGWHTPERVTLPELVSLTEHENIEIKHFGGTATYTRAIEVPKELIASDRKLYLDLGTVEEMAEVLVNGKNLGMQWCPPYRVEITDVVRPGKNEVEVRVTGVLYNRMARDPFVPPEDRVTTVGGNRPAHPVKPGEAARLVPMGLIGPVRLVSTSVITLKP